MKIYTKTGDKGFTHLWDGQKTMKSDIRFTVVGEIDELSSRIGVLISFLPETIFLRKIQTTLQHINSHIVTIKKQDKLVQIEYDLITELEETIDEIERTNTKLTKFILPGSGSIADAFAHMCRTQCRKVERILWESDNNIILTPPNRENIFSYINRLSDYFFVLARSITPSGKECYAL